MSNVWSQSVVENSTRHGMHRRASSALILIAIFFVVGELGAVRGDNVLEADGPGQNLTSIDKIYSTSTAQPAILAIHGGTILSINDLIAILPPGGLTGLQAQGIGSRITAENLRILALGVGQTGIVGARGIDGGLVILDGGKIEIVGDNSVGLFADNGKIFGTNLTVATLGRGAAGVEADNGGSIRLNGGSITTAGINAYGASVSGAGSSIAFTNSDVLSSQGSGASVDNGARLTLAGSSLTALVHGIVATRGTAAAPNSIVISGGNLITVFGDAFQVQDGAANITVSNSATVTGNSALLRVLDPASATIVNFNASHASLFGDIFAEPASQTTVNLTDSTVLTGKVNPPTLGLGVDMRIDGSSQWVLTGSSNVKSLSVSPGADIVFRAPFDLRKTLTLGRLSGTGGTFGMNIDLRHEVGDLIDITGPSAGSHLLTFFDRGAGTDLRANAALLVVKTSDGIAGFSGMIDRAVFKYYVVHGNGSSATPIPDDWYLVRADRIVRDQVIRPANLPAGSVNTPIGLSPVDALSNAANAAIGTYAAGVPLFYADMDTLIQRLGDLRFLRGDDRASVDSNGKAVTSSAPPEEATIGTWVRGFGNGMRINDQVSRPYDQNTGGFQLGADKRFAALQGDLYLGGFLSYFNASRDFLDGGDGSTNAFSVGTYATWINPKGWYADLVLKYTQLWNYFHTPSSDGSFSTADYSIPSLGGSLEVGKRFDVGRFFIEPQAQLAGVWEAGNNYTTSNGLMVGGSDQFSLRGRLGLRAGMDFAFGNGTALEPYLKVSAVHEFLGGDRITANEIGFNPTLSGTLVDAGAGLAVRLNQSVYLYGEYDYANGDKIRAPWAVNAGVRWLWGGKSEEPTMVERPLGKQVAGKEEAKVVELPPAKTTEPWQITVGAPGWLANVTGTTGFHGINSDISVDVGQILRHINVIYTFAGEVRRDRFGVSGDLLYLNGQAGASGTGLVSKVDLGLQQFLGEFFGSWRVVQGPRGWLDLLAGFRYTYLGEQVGLQANNLTIDSASTNLVDRFAQQLATPSSDLRTLIQQNIVDKLTSLLGQNPTLPVGPVAGREPGKIRDLVQQLIQSRQPELAAAIRTGAQARVNQIKAQLASQVANTLTGQLNRSFSFYDDWFDPVIGLRGRFNLTKAFYLTAETDVGGFGIGSDIAVQAYGALGCQLARHIHSEVGYRYLYDEFRDPSAGDFLYKMSLHGVQITTGLDF
ncbi:MAG TPA: autotransporter outer membrane beta-barrel domain-containing protein [Chthoniobacterales bacterium]